MQTEQETARPMRSFADLAKMPGLGEAELHRLTAHAIRRNRNNRAAAARGLENDLMTLATVSGVALPPPIGALVRWAVFGWVNKVAEDMRLGESGRGHDTADTQSRGAPSASTPSGAKVPPDFRAAVQLEGRPDGGLRAWSDELPGMVLSGEDAGAVLDDVSTAIPAFLKAGGISQHVSEAGEGQSLFEALHHDASPASEPIADGRGQRVLGTHGTEAPPIREPSREDWAIAGRIRKEEARTIFDSTMLRGMPLRRIAIGELRQMRSLNTYDNRLIDLMLEHGGNADPLTLLPDIFKESDIERLKQKAADLTDAV